MGFVDIFRKLWGWLSSPEVVETVVTTDYFPPCYGTDTEYHRVYGTDTEYHQVNSITGL